MQAELHWVVTQDNQKLCAKTWGNKDKAAMVLVHGYRDNQEVWEQMIQHL